MHISALFDIKNPQDYKLHIGRRNGGTREPCLDIFLRSKEEWRKMNSWRAKDRENFNRRYIFSMMQFYPEGKDIWLFGGIFEVKGTNGIGEYGYDSVLTDCGKDLIGRLKIKMPPNAQIFSLCLEKQWDKMSVHEPFPRGAARKGQQAPSAQTH